MRRIVHLSCGLVMLTYVTSHLLNHAFGVISLGAVEAARPWLVGPWTTPAGILVLLSAALTHIGLALWTTYVRRSLAMPAWQWTQLVLGLSIPFLLVQHALATAGGGLRFDLKPSYAYVLAVFWKFAPEKGWLQAALLIIAWTHACVGLHHWLKFKSWYDRALPYLFGLAVALPVAALLGFVAGGFAVRERAADPAWVADMLAAIRYPGSTLDAFVGGWARLWQVSFALLIAAAFGGRAVRLWVQKRRPGARVLYPTGHSVIVPPGGTILETSRAAHIPHASVCGGRGRCSTCRVRVLRGAESLAPALPPETKVLHRLMLAPDVRLACQARPTANAEIEIELLLPPDVKAKDALEVPRFAHGEEADIAVLFADLRGFTKLSENRLPYDVVFLLNRYFASMGTAITGAGGRVDKFIGDGVMALFGIDGGAEAGCRSAIRAARRMAEELDTLNRLLGHDLAEPLRIGIGIHVGPAIVGHMGYGEASGVTAIGDTVNTASRLEAMTKEAGAQLVVSDDVAMRAGVDLSGFALQAVSVRGRAGIINVRRVVSALELPEV